MIGMLALKLILAPSLIALGTLLGRRWGSALSGWFGGLPIIGAPILLVIALQHGTTFAADTARSALSGIPAFSAFCVIYAWIALRHPWWLALIAGYVAFAALAPACVAWHPSTLLAAYCGAAALLIAALIMPRGIPEMAKPHSAWELQLRMAAAALIVVAITGLAYALGSEWSGVLTVFPTAGTVLAIFTQRAEGPHGASRVLRALLLGMLSSTVFLTMLAANLDHEGIGLAFALGLIAALTVHGIMLAAQRWSAGLIRSTATE